MAAANAQIRCKRREQEEVRDWCCLSCALTYHQILAQLDQCVRQHLYSSSEMEMFEKITISLSEWIKKKKKGLQDFFFFFTLLTRSVAATPVLTTRTTRSPAGGALTQWRPDRFSQFVSTWLLWDPHGFLSVGPFAVKCSFLFECWERVGSVDHFDIVERVEMGQMASMFFNKGKTFECFPISIQCSYLWYLAHTLIQSDLRLKLSSWGLTSRSVS